MTDQYQWWRDALAGKSPLINANEPQSGFYKMRYGKAEAWLPVAIWSDSSAVHCRVGVDQREAEQVWTWCAGNPVSKTDAKHAFEHGSWPGDVAIGHNSGDLSLAEEITDAHGQAIAWLNKSGITDTTSMDTAANHRARLLDLAKQADAERETKVRPHLDAQKAVNGEYKPMIDLAKGGADALRHALSQYMAAEETKARAAAVEKARIENERLMREHAKAQVTEPAPVFVAPEPVKISAGGQRGKKVGLREITRYAIADYAAALAHAKDHPDVMAAVEKVCFAQARAGATVPGVTSTIEKVAV